MPAAGSGSSSGNAIRINFPIDVFRPVISRHLPSDINAAPESEWLVQIGHVRRRRRREDAKQYGQSLFFEENVGSRREQHVGHRAMLPLSTGVNIHVTALESRASVAISVTKS